MQTTEVLTHLLTHWQLEPIRSITALAPGEYFASKVIFIETRSGGRYVLKRRAVRHDLQQEVALLAALEAHGVPVAVPRLTRGGEPYVQMGEAYFELSPHLPGVVITDHYAPGAVERARRFGAAIAQLHTALQGCQQLITALEMNLLCNVATASQTTRQVWPDDQPPVEPILSELNRGLATHYPELPQQLIHRDAHPGNMLFLGDRLSGWLDFEIMLRGPRLFDLCYCATSLLISGLDDPAKRQIWLALLTALVAGYETITCLSTAERTALWHMLLSIEVIFIAFFKNIEHAAGLAQNIRALAWIYENRAAIERVSA
jgi:Ser/Thr protein kinase RdoA (MazF antagonist)